MAGHRLSTVLATCVLGMTIAVGWGATGAAAPAAEKPAPQKPTPPPSPTLAQIHTALAGAKRSPRLWVTVNVCDTSKHPLAIGVRAQMPALGFASRLSMVFEVDYWNTTTNRFAPAKGTQFKQKLGPVSYGVEQGGFMITFHPHAGLLRGKVTFFWRNPVSHALLGSVTRITTTGHTKADNGDPPHYSAATCTIT